MQEKDHILQIRLPEDIPENEIEWIKERLTWSLYRLLAKRKEKRKVHILRVTPNYSEISI